MSAPHTIPAITPVSPAGFMAADTGVGTRPRTTGSHLILRIIRDVAALAVLVTCGWALIVGLAVAGG